MGAAGRKEKPSEAKLRACRENARKPRPSARRAASSGEAATLQRALERLRALSSRAVRVLERAMRSKDPMVAQRAASEVLGRSGLAIHVNQTLTVDPAVDAPKALTIVTFEAPPTWNGPREIAPENGSAATVVEERVALPEHTNGEAPHEVDTPPLPKPVDERPVVEVVESPAPRPARRPSCPRCGSESPVRVGSAALCDDCGTSWRVE